MRNWNKGLDEFVVCLRGSLNQNRFDRGIVFDGFKESIYLRVACFFPRQWRGIGKNGGKFVEEFLPEYPLRFGFADGLFRRQLSDLAPVLGFHRAVILGQRVNQDLLQYA
ncbi:MAG TPA: hypothetical protein VEK31_11890 [Xanthobacteraceae bacterium]|nr:hypothetical protein [Xanthobacteraceae bacterium]